MRAISRVYRVDGSPSLDSASLSFLFFFCSFLARIIIIFFSFYVLYVSGGMRVHVQAGELNVRVCAARRCDYFFVRPGSIERYSLVRNRDDVEMRSISSLSCLCVRDCVRLRCLLKYTR